MSEQSLPPASVVAFPNKEDELDKAGQAACELVRKAADEGERQTQRALALAHKLSLELRAAEDRVTGLEAEIKHYRSRADRAEKWIHRIALEIEQTFFSTRNNDNGRTLEELQSLKNYVSNRQKTS